MKVHHFVSEHPSVAFFRLVIEFVLTKAYPDHQHKFPTEQSRPITMATYSFDLFTYISHGNCLWESQFNNKRSDSALALALSVAFAL